MSAPGASANEWNPKPDERPLDVHVGSDVFALDGQTGKVERLVFSPRQQKVTHLIVERGFLLRKDIAVPIEHVLRADAGRVELDISSNDLNELPEFRDENFVAAKLLERLHLPFGKSRVLLRADRSEATDALSRREKAGRPPRPDRPDLPDDAVVIRRGTPVESHDGRLGVVEDVLLDRHRRIVTHIVTRPASMLTPGIVVPIDWVRGIDHKTIFVDADRDQIEQLPKVALTPDDEELDELANASTRAAEGTESRSSEEDSLLDSRYAKSGLDYLWVEQFLYDMSGLRFDALQVEELVEHAERKLRDLLDLAKDVALANGREVIMWHDLPISPGLRSLMRDTQTASERVTPNSLETYLSSVGLMTKFDDQVREKLPHLLATLLVLAGRIITNLTPRGMDVSERIGWLSIDEESAWPLHGELERALRIIDLAI